MKITVLGNNGSYPAAGGACSGYLITAGGRKILIDCGNGVLSNLQKLCSFQELDAIILTHLHNDHISDMLVLKYAVDIKLKRGQIEKGIEVYAPSEPLEEYNRLNMPGVLDLKTISEDTELSIDNLKFTFREMKHPVKCLAISIEDGTRRFVFSGDTGWCENIIDFSRNADLVMLDAGFLSKDKSSDNAPHMTARECGLVAREAGVKRLLLTHFWPDYDVNEVLAEAKAEFANTDVAELMKSYDV